MSDRSLVRTATLGDAVTLLTLDRAEKKNALSIALRDEVADTLDRLAGDESVKVVVITGAGDVFSAGFDLREFEQPELADELWASSDRFHQTVLQFPLPLVAAVNGPALAGGFALSLLCDLRVAHESATFGYPELPRGIPPSYAAARAVLPATVAQELCLTGRIVQAREAQRMGIVREVVPGDVVARSAELATKIAGMPRRAMLETKRRTQLERRHLWGFLFEEEQRVFRRALLGDADDANGEAA